MPKEWYNYEELFDLFFLVRVSFSYLIMLLLIWIKTILII